MRAPLLAASAAIALVTLGASAVHAQSNGGNVDGVLKIGQLAPQTGERSDVAASLTRPVKMAVEEINRAGGVNGQNVELVVADDGSAPEVAAQSLTALIDADNVDVVVGPTSSATATGIINLIREEGPVVCSGSTTSAELSTLDSGGYFFRTAPPDPLQGPALAQIVTADEHTRVAILARNDPYGNELADALSNTLADEGATVTADVRYDPNAAAYDTDVGQVVATDPDAVVVIGFQDDGAKVVQAMIAQEIGPDEMPIYTADGMQDNEFGALVDPEDPGVVRGIKGSVPASVPAGIRNPFNRKFAKTGLEPYFPSYYYDCTNLLALAAQVAQSDDPTVIKDNITPLTQGEVTCNSFASCKVALDQGQTVKYSGASQSFDGFTNEPASGVYDVWHYNGDGEVIVELPRKQVKVG